MISPEVITRVTVPVKGPTYSFYPDGKVLVDGRRHMYYSQSTPGLVKEVGFVEWTEAELPEYREAILSAGINWLFDALLKNNTP